MDINEHTDENIVVLAVRGRLDSNSAGSLEDTLCERMQASPALIVDFGEVQYVSSAGLRVLLKAAKIARSCSHTLALCALSAHVREVFDVSGFSSIFQIHENRSQALSALR